MSSSVALHIRFAEEVAEVPYIDLIVEFGVEATVGGLVDQLARGVGEAKGVPLVVELARSGSVLPSNERLAECGLLRGDTLTLRRPRPGEKPSTLGARQPLLFLREERGRDAGRLVPLDVEPVRVGDGRGGSHVVVDDPDADGALVEVSVRDDLTAWVDVLTGSVEADGRVWTTGFELEVGSSIRFGRYTILRLAREHETTHANPFGQIQFLPSAIDQLVPIQSPRLVAPTEPKTSNSRVSFPWESVVSAALMAAFFVIVFDRRIFALLALVPLVVGAFSYVRRLRQARDDQAQRDAEFSEAMERFSVRSKEAAAAEASARRSNNPPVRSELYRRAFRRQGTIWSRSTDSPGFLQVRIGSTDLEVPADDELARRGVEMPAIEGVPAVLDFKKCNVALVGESRAAAAIVREVVQQAAIFHSPRDLRILVAVPGEVEGTSLARSLGGLAWLPHLQANGRPIRMCAGAGEVELQLAAIVSELASLSDAGVGDELPHTLIVLGEGVDLDPVLAERSFAEWPEQLHLFWFGAFADLAPPQVSAVVSLEAGVLKVVRGDLEWSSAVAEPAEKERDARLNAGVDDSVVIARSMAPLHDPRDIAGAGSIPRVVSLLSLLDAGNRRRARGALDELRLTVGVYERGSLELDLVTHGPHLLIGGTTGSGKSELLQTLVASAVDGYDETELQLFLFDFKGNATFSGCETLPHTIGIVSNLDKPEIERGLAFLEAELDRRMAKLDEVSKGRADKIRDYEQLRLECPDVPMPRLLVVFDEFASLVGEFDSARRTAVSIAQRGRSVGIHVVLATQRPSTAVVDADVQANIGARVALRTVSDTESAVIIGTSDAAHISERVPGRAILKLGATRLIGFQAGFASGRGGIEDPSRVALMPFLAKPETLKSKEMRPSRTGPTAFEQILERNAAPSELETRRLLRSFGPEPMAIQGGLSDPSSGKVLVGQWDDAAEGERNAFVADLVRGPLLVAGGIGAGKSSILGVVSRQVRSVLAENVDIIGIDSSSESLSELYGPDFDWIVDATDRDSVSLLLRQVEVELDRRQSGRSFDQPAYILIDDLQQIYEQFALTTQDQEKLQLLGDVIRRGRKHRVFVVAAVPTMQFGNAGLRGVFAHRLQLRPIPDDEEQFPAAVGLPSGQGIAEGGRPFKAFYEEPVGGVERGALPESWFGQLPSVLEQVDSIPPTVAVGLDEIARSTVSFVPKPGEHVLVAGDQRRARNSALAHLQSEFRRSGWTVHSIRNEPVSEDEPGWRVVVEAAVGRGERVCVVAPEVHDMPDHLWTDLKNNLGRNFDESAVVLASFDPFALLTARETLSLRDVVRSWALNQTVLYLGAPAPARAALSSLASGLVIPHRRDFDSTPGRAAWLHHGSTSTVQVPRGEATS